MQNIVVTGSIAYDYLMRFPGSFQEHIVANALEQVSLSFLVEDMTKHWGGVAANIAFNMSKLGIKPYLMGTVGRDFSDYRQWLDEAGVDMQAVRQYEDVFTASFFCNTDLENNQIASFYSGAMEKAKEYSLSQMPPSIAPDLVIISPNDPQAMSNLTNECREQGLMFVYDPSQQIARMDGATLKHDMQQAYLMVINKYEAQMVMKKTDMTMDDLRANINLLVITHGAEGSEIYTNGDKITVGTFEPEKIVDPTGAGDAFRAGFIAALSKDLPLKTCGEVGALCATYVLEHNGPQSRNYNVPDFIARFRIHRDDEGALDHFLADDQA